MCCFTGDTDHSIHSCSIFFRYCKNQSNKFLSGLIWIVKKLAWKFESMRYLVTLKMMLSGKLYILLYQCYHESETWGNTVKQQYWKKCHFHKTRMLSSFFRSWFLRTFQIWFSWCFGAGCEQLVHCSLLSFFTSSGIFLPKHDLAKC